MKFQKIALIFAMAAEAEPLIQELGLQEDGGWGDSRLPFRHFRGAHLGRELTLSVNGRDSRHGVDSIGTEPAVLNAYVTLSRSKAELCLNCGTAGGFRSRGGSIGDVYLSTEPIRFHDHRIAIPGFDAYGEGSFEPLRVAGLAQAAGLKEGSVSTGNSLDYTNLCMEAMNRFGAHAKEMEAAGIAWVCQQLRVPFLALKSITDIVDGEHPTQEEFLRNLDRASEALREKTLRVLETLG